MKTPYCFCFGCHFENNRFDVVILSSWGLFCWWFVTFSLIFCGVIVTGTECVIDDPLFLICLLSSFVAWLIRVNSFVVNSKIMSNSAVIWLLKYIEFETCARKYLTLSHRNSKAILILRLLGNDNLRIRQLADCQLANWTGGLKRDGTTQLNSTSIYGRRW